MRGQADNRRRNSTRQTRAIGAALPAAVCALLLGSAEVNALTGDDSNARAAVLAVVSTLFDGMRHKDEALLRSVFAEDARLGSGGTEGFIRQVLGGTAHLDEVIFDETVLVDGDLAMAWTPYNLFVDGDFHHCGVDVFVMRRRGGNWTIHQLDDTRRLEGCDATRRQ